MEGRVVRLLLLQFNDFKDAGSLSGRMVIALESHISILMLEGNVEGSVVRLLYAQ